MRITGHVQGVFYRAHIRNVANALGLSGFARNEDDGSVLVLAQGEKDLLNKLIQAAKEGSPSSRVEHVKVEFGEVSQKREGFVTQ